MANISHIPKLIASKLGISLQFCQYLTLNVNINGSDLLIQVKCKIINQNVVINGSDVIDTSDKIWIVQNGKYLTYPKIGISNFDHEL